MGLADVQLRLILAPLVAVKAIDMGRDFGPRWAATWVALAALTTLGQRWWAPMAALAVISAWVGVDGMSSSQAVLIAWVSLIFATTTGPATRRLLRTLAMSVYLFGALNKLSWHYLSGGTIDDRHVPPPEALFATSGLLLEAALFVLLWRRSLYAVPAAVALHLGIIATIGTTSWYQMAVLGAFNVTMIVLVVAVSDGRRSASPPGGP